VLQVHLAALTLAVVVLAVSGCGNSSKSATATPSSAAAATTPTSSATSTPTPTPKTTLTAVKLATGRPLTHAELLARGDSICTRLNAQLAASSVTSVRQLGQVLPQAAAYERAEFAKLVRLVPPSVDAADWQKFLTETQQWAEDSTLLGQSARTAEFTLNEPLVGITRRLHEHLARRAKQEGFKECSLV
jgi:hypothetical protein